MLANLSVPLYGLRKSARTLIDRWKPVWGCYMRMHMSSYLTSASGVPMLRSFA